MQEELQLITISLQSSCNQNSGKTSGFFLNFSRKCYMVVVGSENEDQMNRKQTKAAPEEAAIRIHAKTNSSRMISSAR